MTSFAFQISVGFNALFSGSFDETDFARKAYNALLPGLMSYLTEHQPAVPLPPNTSLYEGVYNASGIVATIQVINRALTLIITSLGGQSVYLAYRRPYQMQVNC